jgi:23S rRNA (uridine2552-2'-O)-methyltransferase
MARPRELHDAYFRKAKAEGYAARSAYKLLEIQDRHRLLRPTQWVIDLGCAPGSWLQVAAEIVGPGGRVAGVDLQPVTIKLPGHVRAVVGDVFALTDNAIHDLLGGPADVVLSDMAPGTTGDPGGDHFRSVELCRRVLEVLPAVLRPGGHLTMKVFEGEAYIPLLRQTQRLFRLAKGLKPDATRDVSREMFIVAEGYTGRAQPARAASHPSTPAKPAAANPVPAKPAPLAQPPRDHRLAPKRLAPKPGWSS